ncbi:Laminin subunit beta-3 [Collichthys lucidus]|uniref:Laminin subunit beta-3 n=1 Tax=Collichthys lucidus TaxID=240159 RepID=A0A4U5U8K4_COLLU|nr:Laminin subunit beta-3 [Collichthys lucidus]
MCVNTYGLQADRCEMNTQGHQKVDTALSALSQAQTDCSRGACYPPSNDLLLGRADRLQASSTCGITGSEVYCTPYEQRRMKCCPCDSRNPDGPLAHTVQDVLSTSGTDRWWQSRKEVNPVNLEFDLGNLFQLDNLVLDFKAPLPSNFIIERTLDNGRTWHPALYLATDCQKAFPGVPTRTPLSLEDTYCYTLPPTGANPYQDYRIEFSPLHQYAYVRAPNSQKIEDVSGLTGLRVRMTELGDVPRLPGRALSRFYALREMRVMGSCCECNNHAERCHFDEAVYEASGRRSGGVCTGCMHHTTGPKCDQCAPGYQPNPNSRMDRPDACIRCICSAEETVNGGRCEDSTGSCQCKANVGECSCSSDGSLSDVCDSVTGQCPCRPHFHGLTCDVCSKGYWKPLLSGHCEACGCDPTRSYSDTCDQRATVMLKEPFQKFATSKQEPVCVDQASPGPTATPAVVDTVTPSLPAKHVPPAISPWTPRRNLSLALERLSPSFHSHTRPTLDQNFGPRIRALEASLNVTRNSISLLPSVVRQVDDALSKLDKLRDKVDEVDNDLAPLVITRGLDSELNKLQDLLDRLTVEYETKKNATVHIVHPDNTGAFSAIKKAYDESTDAAKKVDSIGKTVKQSADIRDETTDLHQQVQPGNTRDLDQLNQNMARPDLTPVAKQVCGSVRSEPCTPLQCEGGELCPPEGTLHCKKGEKCVGALPLSKRADADVKDVKDRLEKLTGKITEAAEKLQDTHDTTNQVRQSAEKLSNKMKQARDELKEDLKETRDIVKELKDFLSDPSSNLTHIQEVSDWILKAKLPLSLAALKRKLDELKNLAANLPGSTAVLNEAEPQLDTARKLLKEAQDARDLAVGVKADVDKKLTEFDTLENSLPDVKDKLTSSMDIIDNVNYNLTKAKDQLIPAEKALDDVLSLIKPMKPQLDELKDLLQRGSEKALGAKDNADNAEDKAALAEKDLSSLQKQLDNLKKVIPLSGSGGESGPVGDRLAKLQQDAGVLANTTENTLKALEGKGDSLRQLQDEVLQKSAKLEDSMKSLEIFWQNSARKPPTSAPARARSHQAAL